MKQQEHDAHETLTEDQSRHATQVRAKQATHPHPHTCMVPTKTLGNSLKHLRYAGVARAIQNLFLKSKSTTRHSEVIVPTRVQEREKKIP